ncbi:hypothetical protein GGD81_000548 [Rhodobium orientis]|uniref:Sulfotransferase family protein n=1 Tax=Rhodobium orientis TaxID=34017 RepID=A0A327JHL7_9HYPH|nr:hypothetical protein [Rhodobium orientis]MBB4301531.1 hypothetical protein [Rhodobium orientis]MBK5952228.1 hypothetical protein [Rhodobium orientis]RAI24814.1 hypothetical protein CH339_20995 [Rhodobium orientis]
MRRCIVHIGTHKTGSTSLQRFFAANRRRLMRAGVLYPVAGGETAHHNLFRDATGKRARGLRPTTLGRLTRRLKRWDDIALVSSELFSTFGSRDDGPRKIVRAIRDAGFTPEIVLFVRPQPRLFNSLYTQRVKTLSEARLFADYATQLAARRAYDFNAIVAPWEAAGVERVIAIPFTPTVLDPGIEAAFFDGADLSDRLIRLPHLRPLRSVNPAIGPATVEVCRRVAAEEALHHSQVLHRSARRFIQRQANRHGWNAVGFSGLTDALAATLHARYAEPNEAFAERHWGRSWDEVFAGDDRPFSPNAVDATADPALAAEIDALVEATLARFHPERSPERTLTDRIATRLADGYAQLRKLV